MIHRGTSDALRDTVGGHFAVELVDTLLLGAPSVRADFALKDLAHG